MQRSRATVAVIGAGPSGIAAAQQCRREGIDDVLLVERDRSGGLLSQANRLENFPGLRDMSGREAAVELGEIIKDYKINMLKDDVREILKKKKSFEAVTENGIISSKYMVLATGTKPISLGITGERYHPEWRDYTGERVVVVGGGDAAYDYALRLKELGADTTILRRDEPKALSVLVEEAETRGIKEICHELTGLELADDVYSLQYGEDTLSCDLVITAIGREPTLPDMRFSYGEFKFPSGVTDIENFYVIGSLVLRGYRHATLAWGMGLAAAMDVGVKYRNNQKM